MPSPPTPPPLGPPQAPGEASVTSFGLDFIEWHWDPVDGAGGYEVQLRANDAPTDDDETIAVSAEQTSYRGEGLTFETPYFFRMRAFTGEGASRSFTNWSAPTTTQIGQFEEDAVFHAFPLSALIAEFSSDVPPPEVVVKLEALLDWEQTANADRGLPMPPYWVGCGAAEVLKDQIEEILDSLFESALVYTQSQDLDTSIAQMRPIVTRMLDSFAARLRQERCGVFFPGDLLLWEGEEDVIDIMFSDGTSEEVSVVRILATAVSPDPATAAAEAAPWWVFGDASSVPFDKPALPPGERLTR